MIKRIIIAVMLVFLVAPVNMMAAPVWMNLPSATADNTDMALSALHMPEHYHNTVLGMEKDSNHDQDKAMTNAHDHDNEDCGYCMNCSNHCSTTAIISSFKDNFELAREFDTTSAGATMSRVSLLFRPPISAKQISG